jgi:Raf kinase inhibitor-like YbhB/YbcL family protein
MRLTSSAFREGERIPVPFTCEGENVSPPLEWTAPPQGTLSFALFCNDPDAPAGTWHHWAVYDIPADLRSLPEDLGTEVGNARIKQGLGDSRQMGYNGPCPPRGHGVHRYQFHLLALSIDRLPVHDQCRCKEIERQARRYVLAEATLTALYSRS